MADRFTRWCEAVVARLPWGVNHLVPPTFLGFALINGFTFGVDLALLTVFHGWWGLPVWLSVTVAYICAFGLSFVLNRTVNFHSHAPVGRQAAVEYHDLPQDDPTRRCPDITRARELFGWTPRVDIEEGLRRTAEWFAAQAEATVAQSRGGRPGEALPLSALVPPAGKLHGDEALVRSEA